MRSYLPNSTKKRRLSKKGRLLKTLRSTCVVILGIILLGIVAIFIVTNYPFKNNNANYISLPRDGVNFETYSTLSSIIGRTYVHPKVSKTVIDSYGKLYRNEPELFFVYGETGNKTGENFFPHRTHLNGLSVDFMTPMRNETTGKISRLPTNLFTLWGYGIRLEPQKTYNNMKIDLTAICLHLAELDRAAGANGLNIELVIIEPSILNALRKRPEYSRISNLPFMEGRAWFPHDSHYHVDFVIR